MQMGDVEKEMTRGLHNERKIRRVMGQFWREKTTSREIEMALDERMVITRVYDSDTWELCAQERRTLEVLKITCLINIFGIS